MTKQSPKDSFGPASDSEAGAPEVLTLSRSALVDGMVAELLDYFDWPLGGPMLSEPEARLLVAGGIERALAAGCDPKLRPLPLGDEP